jgi:hypothetical protein
LDFWTVLDFWILGLFNSFGLFYFWTFGQFWTFGLSDFWTFGQFWTFGLSDFWIFGQFFFFFFFPKVVEGHQQVAESHQPSAGARKVAPIRARPSAKGLA